MTIKDQLLDHLKNNGFVEHQGKKLFLDTLNKNVVGCNEYGIDSFVSPIDDLTAAIEWLARDTSNFDELGLPV